MDIKQIRIEMGLSQEEFAHKLGVSVRTVSRWETRETKPSRMAQKLLEEIQKAGCI